MTIYKEFKAEIAHKLSHSWTKKCQHIHGHSYRFGISISSAHLNDEGVIVDFGLVKRQLQELIDLWDHSFFMHDLDSLLKDESFTWTLKAQDQRIRICNFNPTAENMARFLYVAVARLVSKVCKADIESVECWETATAKAVASKADYNSSWNELEITYLGEKL